MSVTEFETSKKKKGHSIQAIININYDDRLTPLTDDCPICLLPITNKKLIGYQLDILKQSGITGLSPSLSLLSSSRLLSHSNFNFNHRNLYCYTKSLFFTIIRIYCVI